MKRILNWLFRFDDRDHCARHNQPLRRGRYGHISVCPECAIEKHADTIREAIKATVGAVNSNTHLEERRDERA